MKSIANPQVLNALVLRLERLTPESVRRWGTMTPAELLCHLGDAGDSVLKRRVPPGTSPDNRLPLPVKWLMLYSPVPFPKGVETRPGVNPKKEGTRPGDFAADRARVIDGLRALAVAAPESVSTTHFRFGAMSLRGWQHWAFKHVDHHLRQFGL
ncbi:MAG: DinB family protein [Gemmatimonadota bacterium]